MRILLRGYKHPLASPEPAAVLRSGLLGGNSGNLVFSEAAWWTLATNRSTPDVADLHGRGLTAGEINERYDAVVLPFANAFRPDFVETLDRFTDLIDRLRVPVTVLGIGAQSDLDYSLPGDARLAEAVRRFARAVLERSPTIGVRGEFTRSYLHSLGFSAVQVIGCPSMFRWGANLPAPTPPARLDRRSRVAINLTPRVEHPGLVERTAVRSPLLHYVPQGQTDLRLMLGLSSRSGGGTPEYPHTADHPLFSSGRARFFIGVDPWLDFLRTMDFTFGTRIHGNVAALLAGCPAHVVAHDSRTREIAEYFEIPHTHVDRLLPDDDAQTLLRRSDYTAMCGGHRERFERFAGFLDDHRLEHVHRPGVKPFVAPERDQQPPVVVRPRTGGRPSTPDRSRPEEQSGRRRRVRAAMARWRRSRGGA